MAPFTNIDIDLLQSEVSDPACPALTTDAELAVFQSIIASRYPALASKASLIRPHSMWLENTRCNTETARYSRRLIEDKGFKDDKCLVSFLVFLAGIHDLGHLQWLINEHGGAIEDFSSHGKLTFDLLEKWGVKFTNPITKAMTEFVLTHHTDINLIPTPSDSAGPLYKLAYFYVSIIRDAEALAEKEAQNN